MTYNYNPHLADHRAKFPRENRPYYIGMTDEEIQQCLKTLGLKNLEDLFDHIPTEQVNEQRTTYRPHSYEQIIQQMEGLAARNWSVTSFLGDGLYASSTSELVKKICGLRGLTTAYTPYQPERSQGTLQALWLYQSVMVKLTGMNAINASLYDRSTATFEAINACMRYRDADLRDSVVLIAQGVLEADLTVLKTHTAHVGPQLVILERDPITHLHGRASLDLAWKQVLSKGKKPLAIVFSQINDLGLIEDVDLITDWAKEQQLETIGLFEPRLIAGTGGLKAPGYWGSKQQGVDFCCAEAQSLTLAPNFGGPGLGVFGVNLKGDRKNALRATPGRYIGKAKDLEGRDCKVIVLSTREQHIRRDKATSNICSNQSFLATIAGAQMLTLGQEGLKQQASQAAANLAQLVQCFLNYQECELVPGPLWCEATMAIDFSNKNISLEQWLADIAEKNRLILGLEVTSRASKSPKQLLKIATNHLHQPADLELVKKILAASFTPESAEKIKEKNLQLARCLKLPGHYLNQSEQAQKQVWNASAQDKVFHYYEQLSTQNLSPDEGIYPLGSCTMKYNPLINDWAAGLSGFTSLHPQVPQQAAQGNLELLWHIQEFFKQVTGLAAVTTQPLAGAQGELVGIKMFQAYHAHRGDHQRRYILIPKSAHGTNPATAAVAGLGSSIVLIDSDERGLIDLPKLRAVLEKLGPEVLGIMVTNPNTAGLYEADFADVAKLIHQVGGLVYMDGANMNAIAGMVDLGKLGVDAVHNNLHKTWTIPHGGGGPGDAIVAVSEKLVPFLPGLQVHFDKQKKEYRAERSTLSIGSFHRHWGNFAHKIRAYSYILALGIEGSKKMSSVAVLSSRYLLHRLKDFYPLLPLNSESTVRMHEFIITLPEDIFLRLESMGMTRVQAITRMGKLFLDFGFHAPTVAFPEPLGLMIEPTESFTKKELDHFADVVIAMGELVREHPAILQTVPHFTPIGRVDEVAANKQLQLFDEQIELKSEALLKDRKPSEQLRAMTMSDLKHSLLQAHEAASKR